MNLKRLNAAVEKRLAKVSFNNHPKEFFSQMTDAEYKQFCQKAISALEEAIKGASGSDKIAMQSELKHWKSEKSLSASDNAAFDSHQTDPGKL